MSAKKPQKNPIISPVRSPLINPKDAVKIINRFGTIPPKLSPLKTVVWKRKHIIIKNADVTTRFTYESPMELPTVCLSWVITSTSSKCSKSTAGVISPDLVKLLESTLMLDMYPIKMPGRYLSLMFEVTILSPYTTRSALSVNFSKLISPSA